MYDQKNIKEVELVDLDATLNSAMSSLVVPSEEGVSENKNDCDRELSQEKVSQQEALEKFKLMVVRDDEIKVFREVYVDLESGSKKLREKLRQKEDTEEEAFEEFSSTLDNVLEKLSQENESLDDFYGLMYDTDDDVSISGKKPIQLVVSQKSVHEGVAEKVIEMANDQAEALSSDKEVTDECLDDEQVGESRPSKRIRVIKEEMVKDQKSKKA
ncbi:hypothetical protein Tco_0574946 [Tanacetum coccineum]